MRRMSFSATVEQMRNQTKTVTRRAPSTWQHLEPGDRLVAVEKAMGLKPGEKQVVIGVIEIVSNRVEPMARIQQPGEAEAEGFCCVAGFGGAWMELNGGGYDPDAEVRRIEFRHVEAAP